MSHMLTSTSRNTTVTADYVPGVATISGGPADPHVRVRLGGGEGMATLFLDMEHVRELAEMFPRIVMAHDAAERDAKVRAAATTEAA